MALQLDDFGTMARDRYIDTVNKYNALVEQAKSVESKEKFAETFMATDPSFAEVNEKIEKLESMLEDLLSKRLIAAQPLIEPAYEEAVKGAGVNPEALKQMKSTISATSKYLTSMYGDEVLADTPKVETIRSSGGGGGTGGRRIRGFDVYVDGVLAGNTNKDGVVKSTFAAAAKMLSIETNVLQRAFFDEAGREDVKADDFPSMVDFTITDGANVERKIRCTKVDDSADDDDSDSE